MDNKFFELVQTYKKQKFKTPYAKVEQAPVDVVKKIKHKNVCICFSSMLKQKTTLFQWLTEKSHNTLYFIDINMSVFPSLYEQGDTQLLLHPRVHILSIKEEKEPLIRYMSMYLAHETMLLNPVFLDDHLTEREAFFQESYQRNFYVINCIAKEFSEYGKTYFKNCYANSNRHINTIDASCFSQAFQNIPALICGAGDSLSKHLIDISCFKQKGLVFSAGSASSFLNCALCKPHFQVIVDPLEKEFECLLPSEHFEVLSLCSNRLFSKAGDLFNGGKVYIGGDSWYPLSIALEQVQGFTHAETEFSYVDGPSSTTVAIQCALAMGCSPIILVGVDLSSKDKASINTWQPIINYRHERFTSQEWLDEANRIKNIAKKYPKVEWFNVSHSGISLSPMLTHTSLKNICKDRKNKVFESMIYNIQSQAKNKGSIEKVRGFLNKTLIQLEELSFIIFGIGQAIEEKSAAKLKRLELLMETQESYINILKPFIVFLRPYLERGEHEIFNGWTKIKYSFLLNATKKNIAWLKEEGYGKSS